MSLNNQDVHMHQRSFNREYKKKDRDVKNINFPLEEADLIKRNRGPYGDKVGAYFYRRFMSHIIGLLQVKDSNKILNIGCGLGFAEKNLVNLYKNLELWSIDISSVMINKALDGDCPSKLSLAIAEKLPFENEMFDRVFSQEVIEHVISPSLMIKEIARCLKPGGLAVITTVNESSLERWKLHSKMFSTILTPLFGIKLEEPLYKDDPPTLKQFKAFAESSGLILEQSALRAN